MNQNILESKLRNRYLKKVKLQLMIRRKWAYLRYLHLREGFLQAKEAESFLSIGCGTGLAEVALALEFPEVRFYLTDIDSDEKLKYRLGMRMVREWSIPNVNFGSYDVLKSARAPYDFVASVEVLEHIQNDFLAVANMLKASTNYVFTLVPFATAEANADPILREQVWKNQQHYRVGYNSEDLQRFFPNIATIRGCYWQDKGFQLRQHLENLSNEDIRNSLPSLIDLAINDVCEAIPNANNKCYGIWAMTKVDSVV